MLVVVGAYPPPIHGASRVASLVVEQARERGHQVLVISTAVQGRGYHVRRVLKHVALAVRIAFHARPSQIRLYQTGAGGLALYYQALIAAAARIRGIQQTFHHHSYAYLGKRSRAMSWLVRLSGPETLHIVLCDGMERRLHEVYGDLRSARFSNALFVGPGVRTEGRDDLPFVVGHLSNLSNDKGIDAVLDVVRALREDGLDVRLRLAGPAADPRVRTLIEQHLASAPDDEWLGPLDPIDVPAFMRGLDCFLFPSRYVNEALPLVVLEALREGTPAVATRVGCLGDLLAEAGWTASGSVADLAMTTRRILAEPGSRDIAANIYSQQHSSAELDRFFEAVVG